MQILYETTWLAPGQAQSPDQFRLNGEQIVDEAEFFRAAQRTFYPRGNVSVEFSFVTHWVFDTTVAAEVFVLTHINNLPMSNQDSGPLQCVCGPETPATAQKVYMQECILKSARILRYIGVSVDVEYSLVGPGFSTDIPPNIPPFPNPNEQATIVFRRGSMQASMGVGSLAITFSSPFSTTPVVVACVQQPTGSVAIFCRIRSDSVTVNGFTVDFSETTYDANAYVNYFAVQ